MPCSLPIRSEEHTSELQSHSHLVCRVLFRSDRKSTRLNSSHTLISYAVFCLKKKHYMPPLARAPGGHPRVAVWLGIANPLVLASSVSRGFFFKERGPPEISPFPLPAALPI